MKKALIATLFYALFASSCGIYGDLQMENIANEIASKQI